MSSEVTILEQIIEAQQVVIDSLGALVNDKLSELESCKKTIAQMQADRIDEIESITAKNFARMKFSD